MKESKWSLKKPLYLDEKDDRYEEHVKQLRERGFSDSETWCLCAVVAEFILPRLKKFREITIAHLADCSMEEWQEKIDKMIFAFEWTIKDIDMTEDYLSLSAEEKDINWTKHKEGIDLFAEHFMGLWW